MSLQLLNALLELAPIEVWKANSRSKRSFTALNRASASSRSASLMKPSVRASPDRNIDARLGSSKEGSRRADAYPIQQH